jgi:hypothetical protein
MELTERLRSFLAHGRRAAASGELPLARQWLEIMLLLARGGNGPGYYYMAGMARRSIPWREKAAHLGSRAYRNAVHALNDTRYFKVSQHKLAEKSVLTLAGIPTPRFLGYFHPHAGRTCRNRPLTSPEEWLDFLRTCDAGRFCVKLAEGSGGVGFQAFEIDAAAPDVRLRSLSDARDVEPLALYERLVADSRASGSGLVVEEYLDQHETLRQMSQASVNSVRLWVVIDENGPARFPLAFLRMGRGASLVDNRSRGGLVAPVDPRTGIVSNAFDGYPSREEFATHPDTGVKIAGTRLPFWQEALDVAERAVRTFPGIRFAGIDVAFARSGPVILELNVEPDRTGAAITGVPSGSALQIQA